MQAIAEILDNLATWQSVQQLEFLISPGGDPMTTLQVQLDRQIFPLDRATANLLKPSSVCDRLETQRVYVFSSHTPNN